MIEIGKVHAKAIATAALTQAVNDVRYYLNGVFIEPHEKGGVVVVGTDGHRMLMVNDFEGEIDEPRIIAFPSKCLTRMRLRGSREATLHLSDDGQSVLVEVMFANGNVESFDAKIVDGKYPDWQSVTPVKLPSRPVGFSANPHYVSHFGKVGDILGLRKQVFGMYTEDENKVVCVPFYQPKEHRLFVRGLLMPVMCKMKEYEWNPPNPQGLNRLMGEGEGMAA